MAKKSTWGHLVGTIPNLPPDPSYDEAMQAKVAELKTQPLELLFEDYNKEDAVNEGHVKEVKDSDFRLEALTRAITDLMDARDLQSVTTRGFNWTSKPEPYPQVADKSVHRAWALANMPDSVSLPFQTLRAVVKARLEDGDTLPAGVEVFLKRSLHRTKA